MDKLVNTPDVDPGNNSSESRPVSAEKNEEELMKDAFRDEIIRNYGPDYWWYEDCVV